jgi:hypothetical protein
MEKRAGCPTRFLIGLPKLSQILFTCSRYGFRQIPRKLVAIAPAGGIVEP